MSAPGTAFPNKWPSFCIWGEWGEKLLSTVTESATSRKLPVSLEDYMGVTTRLYNHHPPCKYVTIYPCVCTPQNSPPRKHLLLPSRTSPWCHSPVIKRGSIISIFQVLIFHCFIDVGIIITPPRHVGGVLLRLTNNASDVFDRLQEFCSQH